MKTLVLALLILASAVLCLQVNARRLILEEEKEGVNNQLTGNAQPSQNLDGANNGTSEADDLPGKSGTSGSPNDDDNKYSTASNNSRNNSEDEKNSSYGSNGNSSESSPDTHHVYGGDLRPPP